MSRISTLGLISPHSQHEKNYMQPFQIPSLEAFSPEVNITITLFPSYYHVGMIIKYVGSTQPFIRDVIQFPRNFTVLSIKDNKADLTIKYNLTTKENRSDLSLMLNRSLLPSEIVHVGISGVVRLHRSLGLMKTTVWWQFKERVAFQQVNARIFPDVAYFNASMTPDRLRVDEDGFLTLTWSIFLSRGFEVTITTYNTEKSLNELLLMPNEISAIITNREQQLAVTIVNVALDPVEVMLTTPEWLKSSLNDLLIAPLSERIVFFSVGDLNLRSLTGFITVTTNRSNKALTIDVTISIQPSNGGDTQPLTWLMFLVTVLLIILTGGMMAFTYQHLPNDHALKRKLSNVRSKFFGSPNVTVENPLSDSKPVTTEWNEADSYQEVFLQAIQELPVNERKFLEYVLAHPGCTQQEVVEALGMSKSTVSRIAKRLHAKKLLKIEKTGMSNALHVKNHIRRIE